MIPTLILRRLNAHANPAAITVLPTHVLVPVMNSPRIEILLERWLGPEFN